ncbi:S41 family peptidase [Chitinophaga sp. CC14]|uniref:S41 family peptidase n=1 Tax=Chitinophaga sp. CC14 TaxID=3029199 RepID=UPI003B7E5B97
MRISYSLLLAAVLCAASCRKQDREETIPLPGNREALSLLLDSVYLYAQQLYYWNKQLPSFEQFAPRSYANGAPGADLDHLRKELFELTRFAVNPATGQPYELHPYHTGLPKYSTIVDPRDPSSYKPEELSAVEALKAGVGNFGLSLAAAGDNDIRIVTASKGGAAAGAGLKRGDRVQAVNGRTVATTDAFYSYASTALSGATVKLEMADGKSGVVKQVTLVNITYAPNPLYKEQLLDAGGEKIGYFAYERFTEEQNTRAYLDPLFKRFAQQGVRTLIVDLRYNGGGFQNTCRYLANMIVPVSADGQVMFKEYYNPLMQSGQATILKQQYILDGGGNPVMVDGRAATLNDIDYSVEANTSKFEKTGGLAALKRVYFIVSGQTASASELLINSLKPYMDVRLIGVSYQGGAVRTYGKPVGFFDISVNRYKLYLSLYQNKNAKEEGDFFAGMPADVSVLDDPSYDFGDVRDPAVHSIMNIEAPGQYPRAMATARTGAGFPVRAVGPVAATQYGLIKQVSELHLRR